MSQDAKSRKPRIRIPESRETKWREKVHPFFIRMLEYNNRVFELQASQNPADREEAQRLANNPPPELIEEAHRMHNAIPPSERAPHDAYLSIFGAEDSKDGGTISADQVTLGWLAWNKFGKSITELSEGDVTGDEKSSRQLLSVEKDYQDWRYGKLDLNRVRSKFDCHHISIMRAGLELGLRSLSSEELADCYDALCKCGKSHAPDNLKKLRTRVMRTMDRLTKNLSNAHTM
jgi:hypothetical protein